MSALALSFAIYKVAFVAVSVRIDAFTLNKRQEDQQTTLWNIYAVNSTKGRKSAIFFIKASSETFSLIIVYLD